MMLRVIFFLIVCSPCVLYAQNNFNNLSSFLELVEKNSLSIQSANLNILQAKQGKLAAILSVPDISGNINATLNDNITLPVTIVPAIAFGGPANETRQLRFGTNYQSGFTQNIDIKIVNLSGYKNIKLANLNIQISETDALLNKKNLFDNIATTYYNILQLQIQSQYTQNNLKIADSLLTLTQSKYQEGIAKQQDINDAQINVLNLQENISQLKFLINQQFSALKTLADLPDSFQITISESIDLNPSASSYSPVTNLLPVYNLKLKEDYAAQNLEFVNRTFLPTLSIVANNAYNTYNESFSFFGGSVINSNYIGLKLNWLIPSSTQIANKVNAKYNVMIAKKSREQALIKANNDATILKNDLDKALSQLKYQNQVLNLQNETYFKNLNLYQEGIQSLVNVLNIFNNKVNAEYNTINSQVAVALALAKIEINNKFSNYAK
ncbi:MAG: TolC family protein [Alphaproteobacteria bacterium]|nr:TolC family protein [Alphaproteobacteria bacterium]